MGSKQEAEQGRQRPAAGPDGVMAIENREKKHIVLLLLNFPLPSSTRITFRPAMLDQALVKDS